MSRQSSLVAKLLTVIAFGILTGCEEPNIPGGVLVQTQNLFDVGGLPVTYPVGGINVNGQYKGPLPNTKTYGTVTSFPFIDTDDSGQFVVDNGIQNAYWASTVIWPDCGATGQASGTFAVTVVEPVIGWLCDYYGAPIAPNPSFVTTNSLPGSLTISQAGFSGQYGAPLLVTYLQGTGLVSTLSATSVAPDGSSAVFPFPTQSNGTALSPALYSISVSNKTVSGQSSLLGLGFFSVGSASTSLVTPFGVDAVDIQIVEQICDFEECDPATTTNTTQAIATLSSTGQVSATHGTIVVGSEPTAIKAYGYDWTYRDLPRGGTLNTYQPFNAIVTNFGGNTVSILDLIGTAVVATIPVGVKPVTVTLNSSQTFAYVPNYGGSTVSEINLTTNTQSRVASVGAQPEAVAMDPGGSALWVGGLNNISEVSLSTFTVIKSFSVSGQVTSLAVSAGQNSLVYTTMTAGAGSTTFQAAQTAISTGAVQGTYAQYVVTSSSPYADYAEAITTGGSAPGTPGWLMPGGALVSATYGNGAAVVGTPTGFAVIDLVKNVQILQGTTATPVRGIATDINQGIVYLTAPDSNTLLTVPLPAPDPNLSSYQTVQ